AVGLDFVGRESFLGIESNPGLYCPVSVEQRSPPKTNFPGCIFVSSRDDEKKKKGLGEEIWFCSYMPPFFFDFFFLAFVGLFTRLHIHNGVCLRILLFSRRHDISWQKFPIRSSSLCNLQTSDRFLFL